MKLKVGDKAPAFALKDQDGRTVKLSDFTGQTVILYFYPKDDTPGCTKEACGFRDRYTAFRRTRVVVLGISPDGEQSHAKFMKKYNLPFSLLSDPDHKTAARYGAWGKKKLYGKEYEGILRSTFIIGPDGTVTHVFDKVKVDTHAEDILNVLA
jgi:peroxiredoxin Q/BCP